MPAYYKFSTLDPATNNSLNQRQHVDRDSQSKHQDEVIQSMLGA
jgi:hypothetical protein